MDVDIKRRHRAEDAPSVVLDATELEPVAGSAHVARRLTRDLLVPFDVGDDRLDDLVLAVSEAFTNAVEASTRRDAHTSIVLRWTATFDSVSVEVEDHAGGGLDFEHWQPRPALVDRDHLGPDRGWGIQLMRELADVVTFEPTADGTLVRLTVRR